MLRAGSLSPGAVRGPGRLTPGRAALAGTAGMAMGGGLLAGAGMYGLSHFNRPGETDWTEKLGMGASGAATALGLGLLLTPITGGLSLPIAGALAAGGGLAGGAYAHAFHDGGIATAPQGVSPSSPLMATVSPGETMIPPARKSGTAQDAFAPLLAELKAGFTSLNATYANGANAVAIATAKRQVVLDDKTARRVVDDYNGAPPINVVRSGAS